MAETLPHSEWLHLAKRVPIGRSERVYHGRENRPNLVVYNNEAEWSAYCHKCHKSGRVSKQYVVIGAAADAAKPVTDPPRDAVPVLRPGVFSEYDWAVGAFVVRKGVVPSMLPPLEFSCTRKRILLNANGSLLGRDITELSKVKWVQYSGRPWFCLGPRNAPVAVLVEDTFSAYKVSYACPNVLVVCCLGTRLHNSLRLHVRQQCVILMFDGDSAGYAGAATARRELPGRVVLDRCAPKGLDPKDMTIAQIRAHLEV